LLVLPGYLMESTVGKQKVPIYLKFGIRCLTSCMRSPKAVSQLVANEESTMNLLRILHFIKDLEVVANTAKMLRIILSDKKSAEVLTKRH
jgi:hypothetical protein